jgi:hypothetical protein
MNGRDYEAWLAEKLTTPVVARTVPHGELHPRLFPFQRQIVAWALELGRAAIFAGCGLGKTAMQLEWARWVAAFTGRPVLICAPLAVSAQTIAEGETMGIEVTYVRDAAEVARASARVLISNYERLDALPVEDMGGVVLDESSILKAFMGKTKRELVRRCAVVEYRLACTATPAPNDHMEIGNHSEFLGVMQGSDMLTRWFINDTANFGTYRLKGHAVESFWDWVASWAVCCTLPSDIGHSDAGYVLPPLRVIPEWVEVDMTEGAEAGAFFRTVETSATSIHKEKRRTLAARVQRVAEVVAAEPGEPWIVWCETDYESEALAKAMPDAVEVRGSHSLERKERAALDFAAGKIRVLISKPGIFGWGMNWQHVARQAFVGATWSYELFYQAVRRSYRFGQRRGVDVFVTMATTERVMWEALSAKQAAHDTMRAGMTAAMRRAQAKSSPQEAYVPTVEMRIPAWLRSEVAA